MALTVKDVAQGEVAPGIVWRAFDISGPVSYAAGGESLTAADLRVGKVLLVQITPDLQFAFPVVYDYTNSKFKIFSSLAGHTHTENTAGAYVQNATSGGASQTSGTETSGNLSTWTWRIFVIGTAL